MIKSLFLKCGITNCLDGSEDHLVYKTNDELVDDDTFVREMFMSDSESESAQLNTELYQNCEYVLIEVMLSKTRNTTQTVNIEFSKQERDL